MEQFNFLSCYKHPNVAHGTRKFNDSSLGYKHPNMAQNFDDLLCLEHCFIWLRQLYTTKIGAEVFGQLQNVVLEEVGEDKMVRVSD